MTIEAANALLKTIEEPPPYNHFFIITSSERDIPMTITVAVHPCPIFSSFDNSARALFSESKKYRPGKGIAFIASISFGSIGNGLFWLDEENFSLRLKLAEIVSGRKTRFVRLFLPCRNSVAYGQKCRDVPRIPPCLISGTFL